MFSAVVLWICRQSDSLGTPLLDEGRLHDIALDAASARLYLDHLARIRLENRDEADELLDAGAYQALLAEQ